MNKFPFTEKRFSLSFNQTGKLQVFVLNPLKILITLIDIQDIQDINYTNN